MARKASESGVNILSDSLRTRPGVFPRGRGRKRFAGRRKCVREIRRSAPDGPPSDSRMPTGYPGGGGETTIINIQRPRTNDQPGRRGRTRLRAGTPGLRRGKQDGRFGGCERGGGGYNRIRVESTRSAPRGVARATAGNVTATFRSRLEGRKHPPPARTTVARATVGEHSRALPVRGRWAEEGTG